MAGFVKRLFADGVVNMKSFVESPSALTRRVFEDALVNEGSGSEGDKGKAAEVIKKKAEKVIKDEIKAAEEKDDAVSSLPDSKKGGDSPVSEGTGLGLRRHVKRRPMGIFGKLLTESGRAVIEGTGEMDMDRVAGEAAIKYTVIETLNTMRICEDNDALIRAITAK
jgi:hypothetical protein